MIGYGGTVRRESVEKSADWFVMDFKELVEALQEAVDKGEIKVEAIGEAVKVEIGDQDTAAKDLPKLIQEVLEPHIMKGL